MTETNWGIIGPGNIAHDFARDLRLVPVQQEVVAILGPHSESTGEFAREFNVNATYLNIDDFLNDKNIDAVYIASPHPQHYEQALACLSHNKAVLCEKPMTINADQCRHLIAAAQKHKTFLMEGMWLRFLPSIQLVVSLISQGRIGNIVSIKASIDYKAPDDSHNRYFDPAKGGGSLLDLGIYPVFLACLLLGKPHSIESTAILSEEKVDKACSALFQYKSGQQALIESSLLSQTELPAEIKGDMGTIRILHPWFERSKGIELLVNDEEPIIYPSNWDGHGLHYEVREVLNCIQQNKIESDNMPHAFSLDMIEIMDEIRKQVRVTYNMYE